MFCKVLFLGRKARRNNINLILIHSGHFVFREQVHIWDQIGQAYREEIVADISELVHRQLVTTGLSNNFRHRLENMMAVSIWKLKYAFHSLCIFKYQSPFLILNLPLSVINIYLFK